MYKKHPKSLILYLIMPLFLILAACGGNEQTAEELMRYHNEEWIPLTEQRNIALKGHGWPLEKIEENEGKQASLDYVEEVILSDFEDFLQEEKAIEIHDESVKKLHELLIDADEYFITF